MMVGSGVGGAIALALGSRINAPHGGIIVIATTDFSHILQTLIALIVGTLVSAIMYGLLKPKVTKTKLKLQKLWMIEIKSLALIIGREILIL